MISAGPAAWNTVMSMPNQRAIISCRICSRRTCSFSRPNLPRSARVRTNALTSMTPEMPRISVIIFPRLSIKGTGRSWRG